MKSTNNRKRAKEGRTDYHHRKKMITNFPNVTRIVFGKKCKYYYMGLYNTESPSKPDLCIYYAESRMMRKNGSPVISNVDLSYHFGKLVSAKFDSSIIKEKLVLDLGRRKRIVYKPFLMGLLSGLDDVFYI